MGRFHLRRRLLLIVGVCLSVFCLMAASAGSALADDLFHDEFWDDDVYSLRLDVPSSAQKVAVFEDVVIDSGQIWENVVVVGGDVTVYGTVENTIVVVGGDVLIASGAQVGNDPSDTAVVVVFGDVQVEQGARVNGYTRDVGSGVRDWLGAGLGEVTITPDYRSWSWGSLAGWIWWTAFLAIVAVIVTAIAPRQLAFVRERVRHHFFSSLGWGALLVIIGIPLVTVLLILTFVGILLLPLWLGVVVPVISLFGFVAVGAMVGRLIFGKKPEERGPLMLAAVVGVILLSILWWIPIAGSILLFLLGLVGFGATCVAIWDWRRQARRARRAAQTAYAKPWDPGAPPPGGQAPPV